jgi:PAS domain S-box-containing protein
VTFANRRYRTFFDVDAEDMLGDGWRRIVHEDDVDAFHDAFNDAFAKRESFERQVRVRHPSLGVRWLRCEAIPRIDAGGVFQGYVGANLDVTEAKQAEVDLKRINELLEERVGAALAEKAKAEADLMHAQRMEAVGRLTGGVAHDFNNLLTVVIGALDMMLRAPDDAKRQARLGEAALAAARRGERLTHQLLAFSRRQTLRPEPTDLNALILEGEPLLRRAVGEAVQLELKLADRPVWVNVDPAQFEAALLNLVVNARDAVAEGGHVVVETRVRRLRAGQLADLGAGDHVCVSVSDDGKGIDPDVLPRIFEPFFTTKPIGKGTGLGLSQVYGFSHQSGGGLDVESEPGRGTTIRMFLPAIRGGGASTSDARDVPTTAARSGRRLLLVEDDVAVAAVAAEMIESLGFDVRVAEHAAAALDVLKTETFDVMLTDVVMPGGMSGVDLARQTAADWPAMSIVLASGYAAEEMDRVVADAPWPFVRKPYSRETLAEVLTAEPV